MIRFQPRERAIMIAEIFHTEQWGALAEELVECYRADLIEELVYSDDDGDIKELQAKIRLIPELLHYIREKVEWAGEAPKEKPKPKAGY